MIRAILSDLHLWATGLPHLWNGQPHGRDRLRFAISYKPGWGPWSFLLLYCTTYLAGTVCGYGVVSLSRAWYQRSLVKWASGRPKYRFAHRMTRLLNWLVPGKHGVHTGPWLWGTHSWRNLYS